MTWKAWDWKFVATIVLTLAGLVIPVLLWQVDLTSRSLTVRLLSTSPLQPASNIQNLQISVNGQNIESPFLSTFELVNDGTKPILSSDFETPIEVVTKGDAKLISAQTTGTFPKDIPAKISNNEHSLAIAPFLSNPKDSVSIAVITSGPAPWFEVRGRIVGISEVTYENRSAVKNGYLKVGFSFAMASLMLFLYCVFLLSGMRVRAILVPRKLAVLTGLALGIGSIAMMRPTMELVNRLPYADLWSFIVMAAMALTMMVFATRYSRTLRRATGMRPQNDRSYPS